MNTLREIRRRIQSVENVEQITKAMEMVAVARLHRAQTKAQQSHRYAAKITAVLDHLASGSAVSNHPFFVERPVKRTGVVIVAADRGLCGSYNTTLFSAADKFLEDYSPETTDLILIGRKAVSYYRRRKWTVRHSLEDWGGKIKFQKIKNLSNRLVQWFMSGELDEIHIVYTHFITIMTRKVLKERFLSLAKPATQGIKLDYIFEPNVTEIYEELMPKYCVSKIQNVLDDAYASELAARAFSMRKATTNAQEMIETLTLVRNKIRQTGITREMIEIASGAEGAR